MGKLKKCPRCNRYTLQGTCPECGEESVDPEPPKFSYPDTYGEYRRKTKRRMNDE